MYAKKSANSLLFFTSIILCVFVIACRQNPKNKNGKELLVSEIWEETISELGITNQEIYQISKNDFVAKDRLSKIMGKEGNSLQVSLSNNKSVKKVNIPPRQGFFPMCIFVQNEEEIYFVSGYVKINKIKPNLD